jgi:surface antigen
MVTRHLSMMKGAIFNGMSSMDDAGQGQMEETDRKVLEFAAK